MNVGIVIVNTRSYNLSSRIILLSGDVELNPGPTNKNCNLKPLIKTKFPLKAFSNSSSLRSTIP